MLMGPHFLDGWYFSTNAQMKNITGTPSGRTRDLAQSPAGALVEALAHLELDPARLPKSYRLLKAEAPDDLSRKDVTGGALPKNWFHDQIATRTIGDEWLASRTSALMRVPSGSVA